MLILLILTLILCLLSGFPVAFVLAGVSLIFAFLGAAFGVFDITYLSALPNRIFGIMQNEVLMAVPLFVFMGVMLERAKIAEELLHHMACLFGSLKSGLGLSVMVVGVLLAASTGIVGATVVTMGLISLPCMLKAGYSPRLSTGSICAAGTLGQIIPPSIVLILLGDQIAGAHQTTQLRLGNLSPDPVSIADLFVGAIIPGLFLVVLYMIWMLLARKTDVVVAESNINFRQICVSLFPPLLLIFIVLGSILAGIATATESAAVGAVGAMFLAFWRQKLTRNTLSNVVEETARVSAMVFTILIGATIFSLVFRGYGGDEAIEHLLTALPGGLFTVMLLTMLLMFVLGFILDFIEIIFVVVPIIAPVLLMLGADPVWLAIMIAINLQTSFLTPPFGFALFYLRGVAPKTVATGDIYKGVLPFVVIQLMMLGLLSYAPQLATALPDALYHEKVDYVPSQTLESYEIDF